MAKNSVINIIISMINYHEEEGDKMRFTKEDIKRFMDEYGVQEEFDKGSYNELGAIILYENKYINLEQFAKQMDLVVRNGKLYLEADSFEDILDSKYETEAKVLDGEYDWDHYGGDYSNYNVTDYWSDYNEKTLKQIIRYCMVNKLSVTNDDGSETKINWRTTKIIKGDIIIKTKDGDKELTDFLDDDLEDLKRELQMSIEEAQESADQDEMYSKIKSYAEDTFGEWERETREYKTYQGEVKHKEVLIFSMDFKWDEMKSELMKDYTTNNITNFVDEERYGSWLSYIRENDPDRFEMRTPDYNYLYGSIDDDTLNSITQDRLY